MPRVEGEKGKTVAHILVRGWRNTNGIVAPTLREVRKDAKW